MLPQLGRRRPQHRRRPQRLPMPNLRIILPTPRRRLPRMRPQRIPRPLQIRHGAMRLPRMECPTRQQPNLPLPSPKPLQPKRLRLRQRMRPQRPPRLILSLPRHLRKPPGLPVHRNPSPGGNNLQLLPLRHPPRLPRQPLHMHPRRRRKLFPNLRRPRMDPARTHRRRTNNIRMRRPFPRRRNQPGLQPMPHRRPSRRNLVPRCFRRTLLPSKTRRRIPPLLLQLPEWRVRRPQRMR